MNALQKHILADPPDELLYFAVFGSQVSGTERVDSDLDIMFVVRSNAWGFWLKTREVVYGAPGGVEKTTVRPHTPETAQAMANVYGSVEYDVMRGNGSRELYRADSFRVDLHDEVNCEYGARKWLEMAKWEIFPDGEYTRQYTGLECFTMAKAIYFLFRSNLLSMGVKFPLTRDIRALYEMLPPERRPPVDIDALEKWAGYPERRDEGIPRAELDGAMEMARRAYDFTGRL